MYRYNAVHVLEFNKNILGYWMDIDYLKRLKLFWLIITNNNIDINTKRQLAYLYNHKYNSQVANNIQKIKE